MRWRGTNVKRLRERRRIVIQIPDGDATLHRVRQLEYIDALPRRKVAAVACTSTDKRFKQIAKDLVNPYWADVCTSEICQRNDVDLNALVERWRDHHQTVGMMQLFEALPRFAEDLIRDCRTKVVECPNCKMLDAHLRTSCHRCMGQGVIEIPGDEASRYLFSDILRLIPNAQDKIPEVKRGRGRPRKEVQKPQPLVRDDISIESLSARLKIAADDRVPDVRPGAYATREERRKKSRQKPAAALPPIKETDAVS